MRLVGRTSRMTVLMAVALTVMLSAPPSLLLGSSGDSLDPVGSAAAVDESRKFTIGIIDMTVSTLNPNTYTMNAEGMIIFPLYSYLIQWDVSNEHVIGDLAYDWWVSPDGLTWEFKLVDNAYFIDPRAPDDLSHKVTSADVLWTIEQIYGNTRSRLHSAFPTGIIADMHTNGDYEFHLTFSEPFVPAQESFMSPPILPKYYWENENLINFENDPPIGSGAFYYATDGLPLAGTATLKRNPHWFGEINNGWQIHCDELIYLRQLDEGTAWNELILGDQLDVMMGVPPEVFVNSLPSYWPDIMGFHQSAGFVYEFNLNQMTDELRNELGGMFKTGDNNQLLLNDSIKTAISMAVDRDFLINDTLYGYGAWTTTLVPEQNEMQHSYGQDDHGCGPVDPVDRTAARLKLWDAGWRYDTSGNYYARDDPRFVSEPWIYPLCNSSDPTEREELVFDFVTLNTADTWESMGKQIVEWCRAVGVQLDLSILSTDEMNGLWYAADYDIWLWDWIFSGVNSEAASAVLVVLTTEAIGTDSDIYWSDAEFDALYNEAIRTMDYETRKEILYTMQDMVYENRGCQALCYRDELYAFSTARWTNFGDLNNTYGLLPDVWPYWLCMNIEPVDNAAPDIFQFSATPIDGDDEYIDVGERVQFQVTAGDDNLAVEDLNFTWIWGDGTAKTRTDAVPSCIHTYTADGEYAVTVVVQETTGFTGDDGYMEDNFSNYRTERITVLDKSNTAPHDLTLSIYPPDPDTGTQVQFETSAIDDEADPIYFSWDFGDGSTLTGDSVTHQFEEDGPYTVTVYADDMRYGEPGTRPASMSQLIAVAQNHAPTISVPDYGSVNVRQNRIYDVSATEVDVRDSLRFTWDWGDGTISVTTDPEASHSYKWKGTYTVEVFADDLTGLDGHNVSDTGLVYVINTQNKAPEISDFSVSDDNPATYQEVTFHATASDPDGDPLSFVFEFDDGTSETVTTAGTDPDVEVSVSCEMSYSTADTWYPLLTVSDGTLTDTSTITVVVFANSAPIVDDLEDVYGSTGYALDFAVTADDLDAGDTLTYTWYWDDGSPMTVTDVPEAIHTYTESGQYTYFAYVDDGMHNVSKGADAYVNAIPVVDDLVQRDVEANKVTTFYVTASDPDDDDLTFMWDFGDSTDFVITTETSVTHTYTAEGTYTRTVHVWDEFVQYLPVEHNVSKSADVVVFAEGENRIPVVDTPLDITAALGELIEFTVSAYDPNDDPLTYTWDFGDLSDLVVSPPPVYHAYDALDVYTYYVHVDDGSGDPGANVTVSGTVTVLADELPVADAGGDRTVHEDTLVTFDAGDSSDDVDVVAWEWTIYDYADTVTMEDEVFTYSFSTPGEYTVELVVTDTMGQSSDTDTITVTVLDDTAPMANAGADQTVHIGTLVTFDGSASEDNDPELGIVSYEWTFTDVTEQVLDTVSPTYTFDAYGEYTVTLTVTDAAGHTATDTMVVTVVDMMPPTAVAGADQAVVVGDVVTFDGSGSSDEEGDIASYTWTFTYDDAEVELTGVGPTYPFEIAGVYVVELEVLDEWDNSATDTMTVTVSSGNEAPVANAGVDQSVTAGTIVTLSASGSSDADGTIESYVWTFTYDGTLRTLSTETATFTFGIVGVYIVTLNVTDDGGLWDTDTVTITVTEAEAGNEAPVAVATADPTTIKVGEAVTFDGTGSTDDVEVVDYVWTFTYDGETRTLTGSTAEFTFDIAGTYVVTLTVTDGDGETDTATVTITVEEDDSSSFIETYGLAIAAVAAIVVVAAVAMMLMKRKGGKGASSVQGVEGIDSGEPGPPTS